MSRVYIRGYGVVSPAGWGVGAFRAVLESGVAPVGVPVARPDGRRLAGYRVPAPGTRPAWAMHPRLRRASPVSHFTMGAALEALGGGESRPRPGGIVSCVMGGSVQYSRRFFAEVLQDPSTASPLLFPETVFNAPASHLAAVLGATGPNDTCVADESGFLAGLVHAAGWIARGEVEDCLVVCAEEADWTTAEALRLFRRGAAGSEGAAAVWLSGRPAGPGVELAAVTPSRPATVASGRDRSARVREDLAAWPGAALFLHGVGRREVAGTRVDALLGNGLAASGGWACVAAIDAVASGATGLAAAWVDGSNLQSLAAVFRQVEVSA